MSLRRSTVAMLLGPLALLATGLALAAAWLLADENAEQDQRRGEAEAAVRRLGGQLSYGARPPQPWLRRLLGGANPPPIVTVDLTRCEAIDDDLRRLSALRNLRALLLSHSQISDAGLPHLSGLVMLETLTLSDTAITGAGVKHLTPLGSLQMLSLNNTQVTDQCLPQIASLRSLQTLQLVGTGVSDAGLPQLAALSSLRELLLSSPPITDAGADRLRTALPNCRIRLFRRR